MSAHYSDTDNQRKSISDSFNSRKRGAVWGRETGVDGKEDTRLVLLNELVNYRRLTHNGFNFYLSVFAKNCPKFVRYSMKGYERWRMRFNVYASGIFTEWHPNTVLHHGELHVYYDLIPNRDRPWCLNFTFYYDDRSIGSQVLSDRYDMMDEAWKDSLTGRDQVLKYLLFLPIDAKEFINATDNLDQFLDCQHEMLRQLEVEKQRAKQRPDNRSAPPANEAEDSDGWRTASNNRRRRNVKKY